MRRSIIIATAAAFQLALASCQLRYEVSLCRGGDGRAMIEVILDRPGDARVRRVTISSAAGRAPDGRTSRIWEMVSNNGQDRPLYRFFFGQAPEGFVSSSPSAAFDPAASYSIDVHGQWGGWLTWTPGNPLAACG